MSAKRRLAAAGFADQRHALADGDVEIDAINCLDPADGAAKQATPDGEMHLEITHGEQRFAHSIAPTLSLCQQAAVPASARGANGG